MIGAAVGAAGSIFGGIAASKAMKKMKNMINQQKQENQNWYDRRYHEDATQRADAQALLTKTEESIRRRNRAAAGTQAVMGGTDESVAAAKEANNKAYSDAVSSINAQATQDKENIENKYLSTKSQLDGQLQQLEGQKAQQITGAIQGTLNAAGSMF